MGTKRRGKKKATKITAGCARALAESRPSALSQWTKTQSSQIQSNPRRRRRQTAVPAADQARVVATFQSAVMRQKPVPRRRRRRRALGRANEPTPAPRLASLLSSPPRRCSPTMRGYLMRFMYSVRNFEWPRRFVGTRRDGEMKTDR
ncbi:hypothetical protein CDD83_5979 [Cordyceps sp. RAO-2017]|nr:hypothetical protein CDD83_5979 [Cordyceps sp. RAO-2017]